MLQAQGLQSCQTLGADVQFHAVAYCRRCSSAWTLSNCLLQLMRSFV